jgi:hypothetical protein
VITGAQLQAAASAARLAKSGRVSLIPSPDGLVADSVGDAVSAYVATGAEVGGEAVAVDAATLGKIGAVLKSSAAEIAIKAGEVKIASKLGRWTLQAEPVGLTAERARLGEVAFELAADLVDVVIRSVVAIHPDDETRPMLQIVAARRVDGGAEVAATDGIRAVRVRVPSASIPWTAQESSFAIPFALIASAALARKAEQSIRIGASAGIDGYAAEIVESGIPFAGVGSPRIDADPAPIWRLLESFTAARSFTADAESLRLTLTRIQSTCAPSDADGVRIEVSGGRLTIYADGRTSQGESACDARGGDGIKGRMRPALMIDALALLSGEVVIETSDNAKDRAFNLIRVNPGGIVETTIAGMRL